RFRTPARARAAAPSRACRFSRPIVVVWVRGGTMRYLLLIGSDDKTAPPPSRAEGETLVQAHGRFSEELRAKGKSVAGERLRPEGEASRVRGKAGPPQVTEGPFPATQVGR